MRSRIDENGIIEIRMTEQEGAAILSDLKERDDLDSVTDRLVDEIDSCVDLDLDEDDDFKDDDEDDSDLESSDDPVDGG